MNFPIVYMVAGMSSRFGGKTKGFAKVGPQGETLLEYSMNQAIDAGFNKIIFIVGQHNENEFKEKFGNSYKEIPIQYALQIYELPREKPWGTGDAVCSIINIIQEPFVVCTGDDIYGKQTFQILINHLKTSKDNATVTKKLIEMLPEKGRVNRGTFETNNDNYITDAKENLGVSKENFKEKRLNENTPTNISIFALQPETLNLVKQGLEKFKQKHSEDKKIEFYLNTYLAELIKENKIKMKNYSTSKKWMGITNPKDEIKVKKELSN